MRPDIPRPKASFWGRVSARFFSVQELILRTSGVFWRLSGLLAEYGGAGGPDGRLLPVEQKQKKTTNTPNPKGCAFEVETHFHWGIVLSGHSPKAEKQKSAVYR